MRDLTDVPTWEDDLTNIGPEEGDDANGEEVSVIGDKLGNRTRWARAALNGSYQLIDHAFVIVAAEAEIAELTTTSFISVTSALTGTVELQEGDIVEAYTEVHVRCDGEAHVLVIDRAFGTESSMERWIGGVDALLLRQLSFVSTWVVGAGEAGSPASVTTRARLNSAVAGTYEIWSPTQRTLKVYRQVTP